MNSMSDLGRLQHAGPYREAGSRSGGFARHS